MDREHSNKETLLELWRLQHEDVQEAIKLAKDENKSYTLCHITNKAVQATFLPLQEQAVLCGPGFEVVTIDFNEFLKQIMPAEIPNKVEKKNNSNKKKRCFVQ